MGDHDAIGLVLGKDLADPPREIEPDPVVHVLRTDRGNLFRADDCQLVDARDCRHKIGAGDFARCIADRAGRRGLASDGAAGGKHKNPGQRGRLGGRRLRRGREHPQTANRKSCGARQMRAASSEAPPKDGCWEDTKGPHRLSWRPPAQPTSPDGQPIGPSGRYYIVPDTRMRRDGCSGRVGWEGELLTGIETVSSRPMRKIVLQEG